MSTDSDEMIIETEGVKVNFGDFWALKGVDIKVRKGEIIVILGPSGSGKGGCSVHGCVPAPCSAGRLCYSPAPPPR